MEKMREEEAEKEMLAWLESDEAKAEREEVADESDEEEEDEEEEENREDMKTFIADCLVGVGTAERKQYDENLEKGQTLAKVADEEEEVDWTGFNEDYEKHRDEYKALIAERLSFLFTEERKQTLAKVEPMD